MYQLALIYLAAILAGFALANIPAALGLSASISGFFAIVGGIAIIVFSLALLYQGIKALIGK